MPRQASAKRNPPNAHNGLSAALVSQNPVLAQGLGGPQGFLGNSYSAKPLGAGSNVRTPNELSVTGGSARTGIGS